MAATMTNIDRVTRTVPMKVLALGMSRTATMSMKAALDILGLRSYHFIEFVSNPLHGDHWNAWLRAKYYSNLNLPPTSLPTRADFDKVLGNFSAVTDMPAVLLADELIVAYPETKVVLVERDVDVALQRTGNTVSPTCRRKID
ncbi:hypothetical protein BDV96DRAFT_640214 [Lophiotrema nucula]|uniref:P-loop containing nucleoside triphosphate hydrolase protein n=1 Tax=Lophiotrema nucula TaxID=690887 RepID=A0A6A5ZR36_9PLEO|nr:hypothetical protein BDV96DRAFT_640214 [Lophiotrema nucula]